MVARMTKRERVLAAIGRRAVDRPPVAFWRHVPDVDHTSQGLADAMLAFHRTWDLDLIKVMSSGVYCVEDWGCKVAYQGHPGGAKRCTEHAVKSAADWARLKPLDPGAGALGRELEAVRLIRKGRGDDAPILHTVFSPLTIASKLAGDRLLEDLASAPAGAARRCAGGRAGGLGESTPLPHGPADAVAAEARDAIRQTGGRGLILTPGCVLPLAVPDANLAAAVGAVRAPAS